MSNLSPIILHAALSVTGLFLRKTWQLQQHIAKTFSDGPDKKKSGFGRSTQWELMIPNGGHALYNCHWVIKTNT